jgi:hypothetical protein
MTRSVCRLTASTTERDDGNEVPVHHIDMDPIGPRGANRSDFLAQSGEVRREYRGGDEVLS